MGRRGGAATSAPARANRPSGPGGGGRLQEIDWDGNILWDYQFATENQPRRLLLKVHRGAVATEDLPLSYTDVGSRHFDPLR